MILSRQMNDNVSYNIKTLNTWFEELSLPVAPACNMMCNFCSKNSDCICNGNDPHYISKPMTPRQAVNFAINSVSRNQRIKVFKISGPGEPLFNGHTFEVLRRLNRELPDYVYSISTNGILLREKADELIKLNVKMVEVSISAVFETTSKKLHARILSGNDIVANNPNLAVDLLQAQFDGIHMLLRKGIDVKVNSVYFPGINDKDIYFIAEILKKAGISSMCVISCTPNGKLRGLRGPSINELSIMQHELAKIVSEVEIKSFISTQDINM